VSTVVQINQRGTITIPKELRAKYGLDRQAILEETPDGLILRPAATYPVEIYSAERLAEFQRMNEDGLHGFTLK
jgi:bifunctional DNA-binding transcriptional regulator/antitoxin component of YhaV-PrlF toxin-antitoxin module